MGIVSCCSTFCVINLLTVTKQRRLTARSLMVLKEDEKSEIIH